MELFYLLISVLFLSDWFYFLITLIQDDYYSIINKLDNFQASFEEYFSPDSLNNNCFSSNWWARFLSLL